jgi:hypothetical protein
LARIADQDERHLPCDRAEFGGFYKCSFKIQDATIILLDAGNRVLPTFAEALSRRVTQRLTKLGVKVLTGVKVETVDKQGVVCQKPPTSPPSSTFWARTGILSSDAACVAVDPSRTATSLCGNPRHRYYSRAFGRQKPI